MLSEALVPFLAVGLAELGDKTQLSILMLASGTSRHLPLLAGVLLAFLIVDGRLVSERLDYNFANKAAGVLFILMGLASLAL